jgi:hypothetical protein
MFLALSHTDKRQAEDRIAATNLGASIRRIARGESAPTRFLRIFTECAAKCSRKRQEGKTSRER